MAPGAAIKLLLATCPRALLRSTLTAAPPPCCATKELLVKECSARRGDDNNSKDSRTRNVAEIARHKRRTGVSPWNPKLRSSVVCLIH